MMAVRLTKAEFREAESTARSYMRRYRPWGRIHVPVYRRPALLAEPPMVAPDAVELIPVLDFAVTPSGWECLTPVEFVG